MNDSQGSWSSRRLLLTTAAAGSVAFIVGSFLYLTLLGTGVKAAILWGLLLTPAIWTALIIVVVLAAPRTRAAFAPAIAFLLAPVASILAAVWENGGVLFLDDPVATALLLGRTVGFAGSVLAGIAVARGFSHRVNRRVWFRTVAIVALLVAMIAVFALPLHFFSVYFSLGGTTPQPRPEAGSRYVATVAVGASAAVAAIACAAVARRHALIWSAAITLLLGLGVAVTLPVPRDRFDFPRPPEPPPSWTYVPCYGEGRGCEGG
ncbi:hypothetical protein [Microbacterium oleivorans]|uniref:hypothetical protein n=1 Tax=Microbacterium oleivorans TaxID=273677 RepID=UPI00203A513A|nr:hypothetical protein [Microbacterium oleivorans]MCM3697014.1 hypothetical protein [Microbacterium oleivorans]